MPGIIVGVDGSDHSRYALEWAIREAAVRHAPLTVLTVQQAVAGYWGGPVIYPGDQDLANQARQRAQEETDMTAENV
jgi:nucleotide-binding universal stress UspA family protein